MNLSEIKRGMPVYVRGRDQAVGKLVASVDHLDDEKYIKLRRRDSPDGRHHWIPTTWVDLVRNEAIILNKTDQQYREEVLDALPTSQTPN